MNGAVRDSQPRTPMSMTPRVRATSNTCYGSGNSPVIRKKLRANGTSDDAGIPRHAHSGLDRRPSGAGLCRLPGPACRGLDRAADAALPQFAARSDRGADLRPRMAARLRQAAAAALVAGRDRRPPGRPRLRLLPAGAGAVSYTHLRAH